MREHIVRLSKVNVIILPNGINVVFAGKVPHEELPRLITTADLGFAMAKQNSAASAGIPLKVYEYLALGIPPLVTELTEAARFVKKLQIGLICNDHVDQLVSKLRWALQNRNKLKIMGKKSGIYSEKPDMRGHFQKNDEQHT